MNKLIRYLSVLIILGFVMTPIIADAEGSLVDPQDLSLSTAKEVNGAFSIVAYEDTDVPIIARSISDGFTSFNDVDVPQSEAYVELSDTAKDVLKTGWLINPSAGGVSSSQNTILTTADTTDAVADIYSHLNNHMASHPDQYLDIQTVPVFSSSEDIMPTYLFIGYRALASDGSPVRITGSDYSNGLIGNIFTGGSEYEYVAVKNGALDQAFHYGTGEPSSNQRNSGFEQAFDPVRFYGSESTVVNDERTEQVTEEDLPPGSSAAFLNTSEQGINSLQIGDAQANGESINSGSDGFIMAFLPIILLGAVLLIAMGN